MEIPVTEVSGRVVSDESDLCRTPQQKTYLLKIDTILSIISPFIPREKRTSADKGFQINSAGRV